MSEHVSPPSEGNMQSTVYRCVGYLGGIKMGVESRIKDFEYVEPTPPLWKIKGGLVITAGSDGIIRLWSMPDLDLKSTLQGEHVVGFSDSRGKATGSGLDGDMKISQPEGIPTTQVGVLIGAYETGSRITCMKAIPLQTEVNNQDTVEEFEGFDS